MGRSTANGICLDDTNISKRHCLLVKTPDGVKVVDLESTNGTWINDKPVKEQVIRDRDVLRIGSYEFRFVAGRFVPPAASVIPGETAVGHPFANLLVEELRRTPFWLVSMAVHFALILLLWNVDFIRIPQRDNPRLVTARNVVEEDQNIEEMKEDKVDDTVEEPPLVIDPDDEPLFDPRDGASAREESSSADSGPIGLHSNRRRGFGDQRGLGLEGLGLGAGDLSKSFGDYLRGMKGRGLDVAIVFDSTGSMQGVIDQVKKQVNLMNTYISALVPGNYRLAMVTYRDRNDEYVVRSQPFTTNYFRILIFVETVHAAGGDDIPESVYEGLREATRKLRWRKNAHKVILLFGDAPPHEQDLAKCRSVVSRFRRDGGVVHTIFTEVGAREDALDISDRKTVNAFRSIARYGGGTFSFLDQESQIVNAIQKLIFGQKYSKEVERLSSQIDFGWKGRLIQKKIRERDVAFLLRHMKKAEPHPLIIEGLIKLKDPRVAKAMREMINDPDLPAFTRSAAEYVLKRKGTTP